MNAETLAHALGGRRTGDQWMAPCPTHEDRNPSLSIRDSDDGKVLVHCHAGCDQSQVISELRSRGYRVSSHDYRRSSKPRPIPASSNVLKVKDNSKRIMASVQLWCSALSATGTLVETYLHSRGISLAVPAAIRFHPRLKHPCGGAWPGMVALVTCGNNGVPLAIHRTFISRDGTGKAPVAPQKMMLGPCRGGAVRLRAASRKLMVGEGIVTCLAAMQATGLPAWAALSTSGLKTLDLPIEIREVIILADGDDPGEAAALDAGRRWKREGRAVRIAHPPTGLDFNDVLLGLHGLTEGGAK